MEAKPNTILIVDDDTTIIEQLVTHFRRRNYEPIATADPTTVRRTLETFEVHLILLDLRMERLNGYEVLKELREKNIQTPVLIITAYYGDEKEKLEAIGITRDDVIEKPFRDFSKIESVIGRKLNRLVAPEEVGSEYEDEIYCDNRTKLIVVDDENDVREILTDVFRERHYDIRAFDNGKEAFDYLKTAGRDCHIAIVDMAIPGLSGYRLIEEVGKIHPHLRFIPISARYAEEVKEALRRVGFEPEKLVTKPFDLPTLVEQVKVMATELGTLGKPSPFEK